MQEKPPSSVKPSNAASLELLKNLWTMMQAGKAAGVIPLLKEHPWLMKERAPKNLVSRNGQPFVHAALLSNSPKLAAYGIAHGAPLEDRCPKGKTALHALFQCIKTHGSPNREKFEALIQPMLDAGARVDTIDNRGTPVWFSALGQPMPLWKQLIEKGAPLDFMDADGWSGISLLINHTTESEKVKYLVGKGANVNLFDARKTEYSPLMVALDHNNLEMADYLVAHGASADAKDLFKRSFLHHAKTEKSIPWLIDQGLDLEAKDAFDRTPLLHMLDMLANNSSQVLDPSQMQDIAKAMILASADLDARDRQETSSSARELINTNPKTMPELVHMLRSMDARQVAMASLKEMASSAP